MKRSIKPFVLRVMSREPATRCDDNALVVAVCREMGFDLLPEQIALINDLPRFSSIVRTRAKIQQQGRFLPSPEIQLQRHTRATSCE